MTSDELRYLVQRAEESIPEMRGLLQAIRRAQKAIPELRDLLKTLEDWPGMDAVNSLEKSLGAWPGLDAVNKLDIATRRYSQQGHRGP